MPIISKDRVSRLTVGTEETGRRLDNFLTTLLKGVPKSHIHRIIRSGEVRINKKRAAADTRLNCGDEIRLPPLRTAARTAGAPIPAAQFDTVFEDDVLLVIDKPAGTAVHGGSGISFGIIEQLRRSRPDLPYLELVHRLDKDTSGLLMIAKKRSALVRLHEAFRRDHPKKIYLALGVGTWDAPRHITLPLIKYTGSQGEKMVRTAADGQSAHTAFRRLNEYGGSRLHQIGIRSLTLLEATLHTGRTHQIRVHMQSQNCPIAGDERYGDYQANRRLQKIGLKRMFLHAARLELAHPTDGRPLILEAPLPAELQNLLAGLQPPSRQAT